MQAFIEAHIDYFSSESLRYATEKMPGPKPELAKCARVERESEEMNDNNNLMARWHQFVFEGDLSTLSDMLAEEMIFRSPFLWKPYHGRMAAFVILSTVAEVFEDFAYHRQLCIGNTWALEFSAKIGDLSLKGIDLIEFNDEGKIKNFEVFIRPANALQALGEEMSKRLARS